MTTTVIDLSYLGLCDLQIQHPNSLIHLILDGNYFDESISLPYLPNLKTLSMNKNKIRNIGQVVDMVYTKCPNISFLSLIGNPGCPHELTSTHGAEYQQRYQKYRHYVTSKLPSLKFLDSKSTGQTGLAISKRQKAEIRPSVSKIQPELPRASRKDVKSESDKYIYGEVKYRYTGRDSEGNRFISDRQL